MIPWDSPGIVAYYTLVRVGSRDEVEHGKSGYAHLFEHMMFRGTERYPAEEYERRMQSFGADDNAYTTEDFTLFTVTAPVGALDALVDLEADRFQHLSYTEAAFRTETGAVLGEYMKSASDPYLKMWESLSEMAFTRHTYGHTTLGYLDDIRAMPEQVAYSRQFFSRYYTPDDCTIIVVGDVDPARVSAVVREKYGAWRGHRHRNRVPVEPQPTGGARRDLGWDGVTPPRLFIGYRTPSYDGGAASGDARARALRDTAALEVVHALAFHESSPLYQRLVVHDQTVLELGSSSGELVRDPRLFVVNATLAPTASFDTVLDAIQAELSRLATGGASAERVAAVKSHLLHALATGLETPDDVADLVARYLAVAPEVASIDEYLDALDAVTPEDVARVAATFLVPGRRFVVTLRAGAAEGAER